MSSIVGTFPAGIKPLGYQQVTVADTAIGLTVPANTIRAVVGVEAQPLRYRDDGTNPSATVGFLLAAGAIVELNNKEAIAKFKAIRSGGTSATLNVLYYG